MNEYNFSFLKDNYLEEAMKMRNLLEEFHENHGLRPPTILGVREHVFTGRFVWFLLNIVVVVVCDSGDLTNPIPFGCVFTVFLL